MLLLISIKRMAFLYAVPFRKATATTRRRRVLRDEGRVMSHGRLLPIVFGRCGSKSLLYKIRRVPHHRIKTFFFEILKLFPAQMETAAKGRRLQGCENLIQVAVHL